MGARRLTSYAFGARGRQRRSSLQAPSAEVQPWFHAHAYVIKPVALDRPLLAGTCRCRVCQKLTYSGSPPEQSVDGTAPGGWVIVRSPCGRIATVGQAIAKNV